MKKTLLFGAAAAVVFGLSVSACDNAKGSTSEGASTKGSGDKEVLYAGILPAADAQGTLYTLKLDFDDDHNYTDGDFVMIENSIMSDTIAASGMREVATAYTSGDFRKDSKLVGGVTVEYICLTPDAKDGLGAASTQPTYFIVNEDGSLTMVGADLEKPSNVELYTLSVK